MPGDTENAVPEDRNPRTPDTVLCQADEPVVRPGHALTTATSPAHAISQNAPLALAATKQVIVQSADWPAAEEFARQNEITAPVFGSADAIEGAAAFAENAPSLARPVRLVKPWAPGSGFHPVS